MNLNETEKQMKTVRVELNHGRPKSNGPNSPLFLYAQTHTLILLSENTHQRRKDHCMAVLQSNKEISEWS